MSRAAAALALLFAAGCAPRCPAEVAAAVAAAVGAGAGGSVVERILVDGAPRDLVVRDGDREVLLREGGEAPPPSEERRVDALGPDIMLQLLESRVFWREYRVIEGPGGPRFQALGHDHGLEVEAEFDAAGALVVEKRALRASEAPEPVRRAFAEVAPSYEAVRYYRFRERGRTYYQATKYVGREEWTLRAGAEGRPVSVERVRWDRCRIPA